MYEWMITDGFRCCRKVGSRVVIITTNNVNNNDVQAVTWNGEQLGANFDVTPLAESTLVDDELKESAAKYHEELVELAVEQDEDVMMAYLDVRCLMWF